MLSRSTPSRSDPSLPIESRPITSQSIQSSSAHSIPFCPVPSVSSLPIQSRPIPSHPVHVLFRPFPSIPSQSVSSCPVFTTQSRPFLFCTTPTYLILSRSAPSLSVQSPLHPSSPVPSPLFSSSQVPSCSFRPSLLHPLPFITVPTSFFPSHSVLSCTVRFHPISSRADSSQTSITCRPHAAATPPRIHNHTITSSLLPTPPGRQHPRGTDTTGCRLIWDVKTLRTNDPGPSTPPFDLTILPPPHIPPQSTVFHMQNWAEGAVWFLNSWSLPGSP